MRDTDPGVAEKSAKVGTVCAAVALGANLGEPATTLEDAVARLAKIEQTRLVACSGVYYSRPLGPPGQPDYLNRVALLETSLPPHRLLDELQSIEARHGRTRSEHWGARTLDLDIIVYGDAVLNDERLTLPHPQAHRRSFVLEPLAELAPEMVIPGHGTAVVLAAAADDGLIYRRPADG